MAQSKGKYWLANNPSAEITSDEAAELDALLPAIPQAAIVSFTDSTGGTGGDTLDCSTATGGLNDDLASLADKIQEILVALRAAKIIAE